MKLSDYVAKFLVEHDIKQVFMVVGGGAMHLDDSFGRCKDLSLCFNHHEQACSMAADSFARVNKQMAAVCVTTGPGGINAMTGVAGAYLDSIPMFVISGQVRYDTCVRSTGLPLRSLGDQEFDIVSAVKSMTKYAIMITDEKDIKKELEKAYHIATTGRKGPVWIDIPLNIQAKDIDVETLDGYEISGEKTGDLLDKDITDVIEKIKNAKRPVFYAGAGIRCGGAYENFREIVNILGIPVVTCWDSIDLIEDENEYYTGRGGIMGDRAGNFAVENADVILAVGNRLSTRQVGYNFANWAKDAYVIDVDVDRFELYKPTIHVEKKIWSDAKEFLYLLKTELEKEGYDKETPLYKSQKVFTLGDLKYNRPSDWISLCGFWKKNYPVVTDNHYKDKNKTNVYAFMGTLSNMLSEGKTIVVGNGSACVVGSHAFTIKKNQRFIINSAIASMGYDLPAAIGAYKAMQDEVVLITGDGSLQMNLQELQTIVTSNMNIKIFVINNNGYHSIRQTQTNLFDKNFVGIGDESGDLSFPNLSKIADAYGYPYISCDDNSALEKAINDTLSLDSFAICEVFCGYDQFFEPKSATKKMPDGTLFSPPLDDLKPFLDRDEYMANKVDKTR